MFLMNVLPDVYICPLRKNNAPHLPKRTVTSGSMASSQRMPIEINESDAIPKIRISVEGDTAKHLKALRIISSEMPISLLTLS